MKNDAPAVSDETDDAAIARLTLENEELKKELNRLSMVVEGTKAGYWDWDVETGNVTINKAWAEMIGYGAGELGRVVAGPLVGVTHLGERHDRRRRVDHERDRSRLAAVRHVVELVRDRRVVAVGCSELRCGAIGDRHLAGPAGGRAARLVKHLADVEIAGVVPLRVGAVDGEAQGICEAPYRDVSHAKFRQLRHQNEIGCARGENSGK